MMAFEKEPGKVWLHDRETGEHAFNAYGLPAEVFASMLKAVSKEYGAMNVRNASEDDGLPPGAWFVLTPAKQS